MSIEIVTSKCTEFSGRIRLFWFDDTIASYGFNGYNEHVTFLNAQNEPGVLLDVSTNYTLETEIFTQHDELSFETHSCNRRDEFFHHIPGNSNRRDEMHNTSTVVATIYMCDV